jgi:hypothetical protein
MVAALLPYDDVNPFFSTINIGHRAKTSLKRAAECVSFCFALGNDFMSALKDDEKHVKNP